MVKPVSKKLKLNNSGSTLVMAILAIAFISLLASVILAAAVGNVIMKQIDNRSKQTFYTAESVLEEVKVGVGKDGIIAMADAYEEVLANLIISGDTVDYMMENSAANEMLRRLFMEEMTRKITDGNVDFSTITASETHDSAIVLSSAKTYLEKYIASTEQKYATIKSIESITFIKDYNGLQNEIILNNVVINYKTQKANESYFADVTVDIEVAYPKMVVDFTSTDRLNDYREYALIADDNIGITASTADVLAQIRASVYAGGDIAVKSSESSKAQLLIDNNINSAGGVVVSDVVSRGDLVLLGSKSSNSVPGNMAMVELGTSNLWCRNIQLSKQTGTYDTTAGAMLNILDDCNSFLADDLNLEGKNSIVNIDGSYYGYSYDGKTLTTNHEASSAIIVDGAGSKLNLGTSAGSLKKLVIGGHAYINYDRANASDSYMTGESLSFTGNQELYLIPATCIGVGYSKLCSNPMPSDTWNTLVDAAAADTEIKLVDLSTFFASTEGLLDASSPYTTKKVGDLMYVYFNFKDKASAAKYIEGVIAGKAPQLADKLDKFTEELLSENVTNPGSVSINMTARENLYTAGVLMETDGSSVNLEFSGNITADKFVVTSMDLANRYEIIKYLLVDLPFTVDGSDYIVTNIDEALLDLKQFTANNGEFEKDATLNIVDWDLVRSNGYNDGTITNLLDETTGEAIALTKVAINDDYVVPDEVYGGIIIANGNVKLNHDFKGMIIASGSIDIVGNANITTNIEMVEKLIGFEFGFVDEDVEEDTAFKNYLYAYKSLDAADSDEEVKIESLGYDDLVGLNNWRKHDDSK